MQRRLALAALVREVRNRYRKGELPAEALKLLTLASPQRQKDYLSALDAGTAPAVWQLKEWLLDGHLLPLDAAIFDRSLYTGGITSDLFDSEPCFVDAEQFWTLQNQALADRRTALLAKGWIEVHVLERGKRFEHWSHEKVAKKAGAQAFLEVAAGGRVTEYLGYLSRSAAARLTRTVDRSDAVEDAASERPEMTAPLAATVDLIRHGAVQAALVGRPDVALRLTVAHVLGGSALWHVHEHKPVANLGTTVLDIVEKQPATAAFREQRNAVIVTLGLDEASLMCTPWSECGTAQVFARLLAMSDAEVMHILAVAMAATLAPSTTLIDTLGTLLEITPDWTVDEELLGMIRDRMVLDAMLTELIGDAARSYVSETGKAKRAVITRALTGDGRPKVEGWLPRWLRFPQGGYTDRRLTAVTPREA